MVSESEPDFGRVINLTCLTYSSFDEAVGRYFVDLELDNRTPLSAAIRVYLAQVPSPVQRDSWSNWRSVRISFQSNAVMMLECPRGLNSRNLGSADGTLRS